MTYSKYMDKLIAYYKHPTHKHRIKYWDRGLHVVKQIFCEDDLIYELKIPISAECPHAFDIEEEDKMNSTYGFVNEMVKKESGCTIQ